MSRKPRENLARDGHLMASNLLKQIINICTMYIYIYMWMIYIEIEYMPLQ